MKKTKKLAIVFSTIAIALTMSITMAACFEWIPPYFPMGMDAPHGRYDLVEVTAFNQWDIPMEDWLITDFDFMLDWGTSFIDFNAFTGRVNIHFSLFGDESWYHSDINGWWDFDMLFGDYVDIFDFDFFGEICLFFDYGYEVWWCFIFDEIIMTYECFITGWLWEFVFA